VVHSCKPFSKYCCCHPCCLIGVQSNREMFKVFTCSSLNSWDCAEIPIIEGFNSSPVAAGHESILYLWQSFLLLYLSPFWTKLFLGICQTNHFISNEFAFWRVLAKHTLWFWLLQIHSSTTSKSAGATLPGMKSETLL
jgi:hypothetical protein